MTGGSHTVRLRDVLSGIYLGRFFSERRISVHGWVDETHTPTAPTRGVADRPGSWALPTGVVAAHTPLIAETTPRRPNLSAATSVGTSGAWVGADVSAAPAKRNEQESGPYLKSLAAPPKRCDFPFYGCGALAKTIDWELGVIAAARKCRRTAVPGCEVAPPIVQGWPGFRPARPWSPS